MTGCKLRHIGRAVVTGAGGFLGRHLVSRLRDIGVDVVALSSQDGFVLLNDELPLREGDHVFHLAAETGVLDAWNDPVRFHLTNSHGTVRVLDQCRRAKATVSYIGAYVYGIPQRLPIDETQAVDVNNPYAFSKWMAEQACQWYSRIYDMPVTAIRLFNVYGLGQSNRFLIPSIIEQTLDPSVKEIKLMDLAPRRDYLFVDDAVNALLLSRPVAGFQLFNVGSGRSYSVGEVVDEVMGVAAIRKPVVDLCQARPNEIPDVVADHFRITEACGWRPKVSLNVGIQCMLKGKVS